MRGPWGLEEEGVAGIHLPRSTLAPGGVGGEASCLGCAQVPLVCTAEEMARVKDLRSPYVHLFEGPY